MCFHNYRKYEEFPLDFDSFSLFQQIKIKTKFFISGNIESTTKGDKILEIPGLVDIYDYSFKNQTCKKVDKRVKRLTNV